MRDETVMFTHLRLENFKSWRELDIDLAPVTILFGTNSSGKSSILQSILLLLQSFENTDGYGVDFGGNVKDYVNLGSFRDVVFQHDENKVVQIHTKLTKLNWKRYLEEYDHKIEDADINFSFRYMDDKVKIISEVQDNRMRDIIFDIILNDDSGVFYLGPIRQHPQRSYLWSGAAPRRILSDGENTIAALVESDRRDGLLSRNVSKWLNEMELVSEFRVSPLDEGKRFYETLVNINGVETALLDTGFGISQVLPVITMLFFAPEGSIILLEQPELHLHPRAQAHLADLILHVAEERKLQLIVESHSEHLLRRLQRRIAEVEHQFASPENVKMYFCDTGENGSTIQSVEVDEYGQIQNWPHNFFGDITGDLEAMTMAALQRSMNAES